MVSGLLNERWAMTLPHTIAKLFAQMNKDEDGGGKPYRFFQIDPNELSMWWSGRR